MAIHILTGSKTEKTNSLALHCTNCSKPFIHIRQGNPKHDNASCPGCGQFNNINEILRRPTLTPGKQTDGTVLLPPRQHLYKAILVVEGFADPNSIVIHARSAGCGTWWRPDLPYSLVEMIESNLKALAELHETPTCIILGTACFNELIK